jgi:hypothetical protein
MKPTCSLALLAGLLSSGAFAAGPALTLYNQNFAVVRDTVPLDLKAGVNNVNFANTTALLEPDSVILRDPSGKYSLQILEQNYHNDPVSQELLLSLFEGKTIEFVPFPHGDSAQGRTNVSGKIVRSGYTPGGGIGQPIVEVDGKLRFSLPGQPIFPSLGDDTILKPALNWLLQSDQAGKLEAEVSYVTGGFTWEADYNLVAPEKGDTVDLIGWITMANHSGKTFPNARIKLMAGDVKKIRPDQLLALRGGVGGGGGGGQPAVTEKSFDEYHLYTLVRATTLRDKETKQVEFARANGVKANVIYVYDGASTECRFSGGLNTDQNYGVVGNKKVWVLREFTNSETNQLGLPLPKGRLRFYRRNDDGQLEFTGEDTIDHTPRNEIVRVTTGSSFDLVGERKQVDFKINMFGPYAVDPTTGLPIAAAVTTNSPWVDESFEIKLRNHKGETAEIRVVEHLYRWSNWEITKASVKFEKTDAQTMETRVQLKPDEEKTVTYTAHYTW